MKNIHLIATDKPSRLHLYTDEKGTRLETCELEYSNTRNTQNIYITSDEEIKEGDWFMSDFNSFPIHNIKELSERGGTLGWKQKDLKNNLKIILTTDQDLIGVQPIDDEFLEWFVKNPSCEFVEILIKTKTFDKDGFISSVICDTKNVEKIYSIIPQEELKQELNLNCFDCNKALQDCTCIEDTINMEQETLEEAAHNYFIRGQLGFEKAADTATAFLRGGLWQAERRYSESDKIMKFLNTEKELKLSDAKTIERIKWYFETYFEQFKKK